MLDSILLVLGFVLLLVQAFIAEVRGVKPGWLGLAAWILTYIV